MRCRIAAVSELTVPSSTLSATLPVKPSATSTSALARGRSKPSRLPMKFRSPSAMRSWAVSTSGVPLPDSSPNGQQADLGPLDPHHGLHEAGAQVGELDEVLGAHLHAGARVEQEHRPARHGEQHRERGAKHAAQAPDREGGGGQRRAGGAGGDECVRATIADSTRGLDDRGVGLGADGGDGLLAGLDRVGRVDDLGQGPGCVAQLCRGPEQEHGQARASDPLRDGGRPLVGAVRVDRDHYSSSAMSCCCTTTSRPA